MATGIYLEDNTPRTQQYRCPRREKLSGIIGVHTAEWIADEIGPDTGAENTAAFIANRTNYGSYHFLADSDSIIQLVNLDCVAYHIATYGFNEHTIGISAAVQASRWEEVGNEWEDKCLRNMARAAAMAALHIKRRTGIVVPARRLTLSEALARKPGFLAHGTADPDRRTDPDGPNREFKWSRFLNYYSQEMGGTDVELTDYVRLTDKDGKRLWPGALLEMNQISVNGALAYGAAALWYAHKSLTPAVAKLAAQVSALTALVGQLDVGADVDMEAVKLAAQAGAEDALASLNATVTLDLEPEAEGTVG